MKLFVKAVTVLILAALVDWPALVRASVPLAQVHRLPGIWSLTLSTDVYKTTFHVRRFRAKSASGATVGVPAHLIDISSAAGGWISPNPSEVSPFPVLLPQKLRADIQVFFSGAKGAGLTGWLVVPRGWVLWDAQVGADGSASLQFEAASGPNAGWIQWEDQGYCCGLDLVAGLIPGAGNTWDYAQMANKGELSPHASLEPVPTVLSNPTRCTAKLTYRQNGNIVHGVAIMTTDEDGSGTGAQGLYVSLPAREAQLGEFIVDTYLSTQLRRVGQYCTMKTRK